VEDSCLRRPKKEAAAAKDASGISVFLLEELGDARLRCAQLRKYVDEAVALVNKSDHRDHFFEVAAHLIHGIPDTLMRMDKALSAAALAASKLDYEEIKDTLRPEKVEELENALEDVRIRRVKRQSEEKVMNIPEAVERLERLAASAQGGTLKTQDLIALIYDLEGDSKTAAAKNGDEIAGVLRKLASDITEADPEKERPSRLSLASSLRHIAAFSMEATAAFRPIRIKSRRHGEGLFPEDLCAALRQSADNLWATLDQQRGVAQLLQDSIAGWSETGPLRGLPKTLHSSAKKAAAFESTIGNQMMSLATRMQRLADDIEGDARSLEAEEREFGRHDRLDPLERTAETAEEKESRFEEGKPADPTKNMSPEDAKKWREEHQKNKDKFKTAIA